MHACAGSHLHDNWVVILRCLSRWALVTQLASGAPTDLSLFSSVDPAQKHDLKKSWWQGARSRQSHDGSPKPPFQPGTLIDAGLSLGDDFMSKAPSPGPLLTSLCVLLLSCLLCSADIGGQCTTYQSRIVHLELGRKSSLSLIC